ncbi:MAG: hypothetical protein AAF998_07090 [Bacteroidota bacterium]
MTMIKIHDRVRAYPLVRGEVLLAHRRPLLALLARQLARRRGERITDVSARGVIYFREVAAYRVPTRIDRLRARATADAFLRKFIVNLQVAIASESLPTEFATLALGLRAGRSQPVFYPGDPQRLHHWRVRYPVQLPVGDATGAGPGSRRRALLADVPSQWICVDVGGKDGQVIGMIIQRPLLEVPDLVPQDRVQLRLPVAAEAVYLPSPDDYVLYPYLIDPETGFLIPRLRERGDHRSYGVAAWRRVVHPELTRRFYPTHDHKSEGLPITLRVTQEKVPFYRIDVGRIPVKDLPEEEILAPLLEKGEVLDYRVTTPSNWIEARRRRNGQVGYVDWRRVERAVELPEVLVRVEELDLASAHNIAQSIRQLLPVRPLEEGFSDLLRGLLLPPLPPLLDVGFFHRRFGKVYGMPAVMEILENLFRYHTREGFAQVMISLYHGGELRRLLEQVSVDTIRKHYQIVLLMLYMLDWKEVRSVFRARLNQKLRRLLLPEEAWENGKLLGHLRELYQTVESVYRNDPLALVVFAEDNLDFILRMNAHKITHYFQMGDTAAIHRYVIDMLELADAGLELLFSDSPENSLLLLPFGLDLVSIWRAYAAINPIQRPEMYLVGDGARRYDNQKEEGPRLEQIFCFRSQELLTEIPPPKRGELTSDAAWEERHAACYSPDPAPEPNPTPAPQSKSTKANSSPSGFALVRESVVRLARVVAGFLDSELYVRMASRPETVPEVNQVLHDVIQPRAMAQINVLRADRPLFANNSVRIPPPFYARPRVMNRLGWIDLARIWFYELGNRLPGGKTRERPLVFGPEAETTQALRAHPGPVAIHQYMQARVRAGHDAAVRIQVHYGTAGFRRAIASHDVLMNLLGSYTVEARPDREQGRIHYRAINALSLESASRFNRDDESTSAISNKIGIVESKRRNQPGTPEMGGSLHCNWTWTEPLV